jgi:N-acetyl-anhydromuramyl-L-alanine amidase AmpD
MDIGAEEIRRWHSDPEPHGNGWDDIGYHYVIRRNGEVELGRPIEKQGAHAAGHNAGSIGVCLVGGEDEGGAGPEFNYTAGQMEALRSLVLVLTAQHGIISVIGHNEVSSKSCPNFCVKSWSERL